ncbi:MAG: hypothetical protein ACRELY_00565 [Polyangiaceae bacterium]
MNLTAPDTGAENAGHVANVRAHIQGDFAIGSKSPQGFRYRQVDDTQGAQNPAVFFGSVREERRAARDCVRGLARMGDAVPAQPAEQNARLKHILGLQRAADS